MVDAREYHERTTHTPEGVRTASHRLDPETKPRPYKVYRDLPTVESSSDRAPEVPVLQAIAVDGWQGLEDEAPTADGPGSLPLGTLCRYAAGVTKHLERRGETVRFRAAACTGKLYHIDLYAVTGPAGPDGAGVYHYDPHHDQFDVLRSGDYRGVLARVGGDHQAVADAPVTLVATSTWWRNAWKYRARTYRHAFWDAGTILANLLALAHGFGYRAGVLAGFADDPVAALLGVDPAWEAPIALAPIGSGEPVPDPVSVDPIDPETEPVSSTSEDYPLIHEAWEASTLEDGEAAAAWRDQVISHEGTGSVGRDAGPDEDTETVELLPVGEETASERPVVETIERRGSLREYSHESISERLFGTVLDRALRGVPTDGMDPSSIDGGRPPGQFVDAYCLVQAVDGLPRSTYQVHPQEGTIERVGETDRRTAAHLALDQGVAGDAAVNVYCMTDVDAVVEALGDRGYRLAMLEAGLTLGRLYLSTYAHLALGGRGFTFYDDRVTEHLSPRAATQSPMTLFAFGRPDK